jgi:hypothetical protein
VLELATVLASGRRECGCSARGQGCLGPHVHEGEVKDSCQSPRERPEGPCPGPGVRTTVSRRRRSRRVRSVTSPNCRTTCVLRAATTRAARSSRPTDALVRLDADVGAQRRPARIGGASLCVSSAVAFGYTDRRTASSERHDAGTPPRTTPTPPGLPHATAIRVQSRRDLCGRPPRGVLRAPIGGGRRCWTRARRGGSFGLRQPARRGVRRSRPAGQPALHGRGRPGLLPIGHRPPHHARSWDRRRPGASSRRCARRAGDEGHAKRHRHLGGFQGDGPDGCRA